MSVKFSQFNSSTLLLNTDLLAGLRGGLNTKFPFVGVGDSAGNKILTWSQATGANVNWVDVLNSNTGVDPVISTQGSDTNINLALTAKGTGHVYATGTGAIGLPAGTTAQRPAGFMGGFRYNLDTGFLEYWDTITSAWVIVISGAAFDTATYITQTDETGQLPNSQPLSAQPSGFLTSITGTGVITNRTLDTASTDRITITNPTGAAGNPEFDLAETTVIPGGYTYAGFSVDAYGRILSAVSGVPPIASLSVTAPITSTGGSTPTIGLDVPLEVQYGGTGVASLTANMPILGGTTTTGDVQSVDPTGALAGYVLEFVDSSSPPIWAPAAGPSEIITQASHGFSVGNVLYLNGTTYALAQANSTVTSEVIGVVSQVVNTNTFVLTTVGRISGLSGLTPGSVYWLSDTTAGLATTTIPTTIGNITKPVWIADTTTSAYVYQERGKILPNPAYTGFAFIPVTTGPVTMVSSTGYVTNGTGTLTYNLPLTAAQGDYYVISSGTNTSGWQLTLDVSQTVTVGNVSSSAGGQVASTAIGDAISLVCTGSGTFMAYNTMGNLSVT